MSDFDHLQKLLRLKRYEQPPDGYYQQFAEKFKERQRAELLRQSARGLLLERLSAWMWSSGTKRWLFVGGTSTALLTTGYFLVPAFFGDSPPRSVEIASPVLNDGLDDDPATKGVLKKKGEAEERQSP